MGQVCADLPYGSYPEQPDNVSRINGEYYVDGTYSSVRRPSYSSESSYNSTDGENSETTRNVVVPTTRPSATQPPTQAPTTQPPTQVPTTQAPTTQPPTDSPDIEDGDD